MVVLHIFEGNIVLCTSASVAGSDLFSTPQSQAYELRVRAWYNTTLPPSSMLDRAHSSTTEREAAEQTTADLRDELIESALCSKPF